MNKVSSNCSLTNKINLKRDKGKKRKVLDQNQYEETC